MAKKSALGGNKRDEVKNPRSGHYVKIDRSRGEILSHKKTAGQYKNIPVARKRKQI